MGPKVERRVYNAEGFGTEWGVNDGEFFYPYQNGTKGIVESILRTNFPSYGKKETMHRKPLSECPLVSEASPRSYSFVSREEDVDYARILRETPESEDFVLVQTADRRGRPKGWLLLVRNRVLDLPGTENLTLDGEYMSESWGYGVPRVDARSRSGSGKFPAEIKQEIEAIRAQLNPKNCRTTVTYL